MTRLPLEPGSIVELRHPWHEDHGVLVSISAHGCTIRHEGYERYYHRDGAGFWSGVAPATHSFTLHAIAGPVDWVAAAHAVMKAGGFQGTSPGGVPQAEIKRRWARTFGQAPLPRKGTVLH